MESTPSPTSGSGREDKPKSTGPRIDDIDDSDLGLDEDFDDDEGSSQSDSDTDNETRSKKKEKTEKKETWKLKVKGQEIDYDPSNVETNKRWIQKGMNADRELAKMDNMQRELKGFINHLKTNPFEILSNPKFIGPEKIEKFAEEFLFQNYKRKSETPEERQARIDREDAERYRQESKKKKEEAVKAQREKLKAEQRAEYMGKFKQALDAPGMPKNDYALRQLARYVKQFAQANPGVKPNPMDFVENVIEDWRNYENQRYESMTDEELLDMLGEDRFNRLRRMKLQKNKESGVKPKVTKPIQSKTGGKTYSSTSEMFRALRENL